jgi:methylated-DNA-[protein]-cysteine S-methyltransferase
MEIETTWGTIAVELTDGKVGGCALPFLADQPEQPFSITSVGNDSVSMFVAAIFSGKVMASPPLAELKGTDFQQQVWREIAKIPPGQTKTYGELASAIGRANAVRAVGTACGSNPAPLFIPCHRVKGANGRLGGFSCGLPWKRLLLEAEQGALFRTD